MNTEFFSTASTGLGDNKRVIRCLISNLVTASYDHSGGDAAEAAAWTTARTTQGNLLASLQAGGFIAAGPWYDLLPLQAAYARSLEA